MVTLRILIYTTVDLCNDVRPKNEAFRDNDLPLPPSSITATFRVPDRRWMPIIGSSPTKSLLLPGRAALQQAVGIDNCIQKGEANNSFTTQPK
jgi:hypothetical protein